MTIIIMPIISLLGVYPYNLIIDILTIFYGLLLFFLFKRSEIKENIHLEIDYSQSWGKNPV
ncbi:MAG: hypothetical protein HeimC3_30330 [Candidatus Heimdallarchaeota archaeon LC_3]|nr:MAG: hypothetical protein HeimC3_30330 [Candidatus Heimdallarchaeota archaeon LC_3]